jgi:glycosyltransferase involved in cell wall biosynthesis
MRRIAIISINGIANMGGVERVVADHQRILSEVAHVRVFSLPRYESIRRFRLANALLSICFTSMSGAIARVWAGPHGIVISHGYSSIGLLCDVVFAHGCWAAYVERTGQKMGSFGRIIVAVEWLSAHLARKVVGVSDCVIEQWVRHYHLQPVKSAVLPNSIDTRIFSWREGAEDPCAGDELRVLFVGRFEIGKGTRVLSRLHDEIARGRSPVRVVVCSPIVVQDEIRREYPLFEFQHGLSPEQVAEEYNRADLFILPSLYEAFELSSIEALACGTPVLLNDTGTRPTLERLSCPGLFHLEDAPSPLDAVLRAARRFRGLRRSTLSLWAQDHFALDNLYAHLLNLSGLENAS